MNPADNIEREIEELHITTTADTDRRILHDAFAALKKSVSKQSPDVRRSAAERTLRVRIMEWAAVAAVVVIAAALFFGSRGRRPIAIGQIYAALEGVGNICVSRFSADRAGPDQQVWTSQTLKVKLFKTESNNQAQYTLWDIPNGVKMITFLSSGTVETEPITDRMLAELEKSMGRSAGLVPFSDVTDIPGDYQWNRVDDPAVAAIVPGARVYELTWMQKDATSEAVVYRKWRVFVDARTKLPKRAQWYVKFSLEAEYTLESFIIVTYPRESEIQSLVENNFGLARDGRSEPEYIGTPGGY